MEFDKSRVYTALNADELKVGSKVFVADTLADIKEMVEKGIEVKTLAKILSEHELCRFVEEDTEVNYVFAYLVSEPAKLKWTDLKVLDVITNGVTTATVLRIDVNDTNMHIAIWERWLANDELKEWEKVEK